jgi:ADP-ribosyl-[dinitrogen reductase] hydrolase
VAGQWTDDTSMALCLAASLVHRRGHDPVDQMNRYANWWRHGDLSSTGECFDIGMTVQRALRRYLDTGNPYAGDPDPHRAGNGALMRLAPVAMWFADDAAALREAARASTRTTHAAPEALDCSEFLAELLRRALAGAPKCELLSAPAPAGCTPAVAALARGDWRDKPAGAIRGSGYCVESLEAALWCFAATNDVESAVLAAANLGDDADTTAAIVGQLAGAHHGVDAIPPRWRERLAMADEIERLARALHAR